MLLEQSSLPEGFVINGVNDGCGIFIRMQITATHLHNSGGLISECFDRCLQSDGGPVRGHGCHPVIYRHGSFLVKVKLSAPQECLSTCGRAGCLCSSRSTLECGDKPLSLEPSTPVSVDEPDNVSWQITEDALWKAQEWRCCLKEPCWCLYK